MTPMTFRQTAQRLVEPRPPTVDELTAAFRARGYRRWYERQLLQGHGWLILLILAMVAATIGGEVARLGRDWLASIVDLALIFGCLCVVWIAWRRYVHAMVLAESIARQARCPRCEGYGFRTASARIAGEDPDGQGGIEVHCIRCPARWTVYCPDES